MELYVPPYVSAVLNALTNQGYEAYMVGGCVRDALLGTAPKDYDVCTSALPEQMLTCFADFRVIPTGLAHGTVTVLSKGHPVEVTTYRVDGSYTDHRHPDAVSFTSRLQEDLARRDFTVNAMAYHPAQGLVDCFEGQKDLQNRIIRCVGEPACRFEEDALRILRGLRFSATLGFALEPATKKAIREQIGSLADVSVERVFCEWQQLLCGDHAAGVLADFEDVLPKTLGVEKAAVKRFAAVTGALPPEPDLRLAVIYADPAAAQAGLTGFKTSKKLRDQVAALCDRRAFPLTDLPAVRRYVGKVGTELLDRQLLLMRAEGMDTTREEEYLHQIKQNGLCCSVKQLAIGGNALAPFAQGQAVGELLERLLEAVILEKVENTPEALLRLAGAWQME